MELNLGKITKELEDFFEIKAPNYEIFIANSREEFNKLTNRESSESWMAGWANNGKIVAIHPDKLEKLTNGLHKSSSHPNRIKHELTHIFYNKLANGEYKPMWLNEGLAFYLDGRGGKPPKTDQDKFQAINHFDTFGSQMYGPSSFLVKSLLKKYGKEKLLKLIKSIQPGATQEDFNLKFQDIYNFSLTKENLLNIFG